MNIIDQNNNLRKSGIDIYTLDNGLRVVFEQNKHLSAVTVGVWIKVGSRDEDASNNGIAHMIEHMLFKGTKKMTAEQLAVRTAIMGGGLNAYTSKENTEVYCRTLPSCLMEAINILGDMICNSLIDEAELEKEKGVVCEEIDMYKDSPEDSVHEVLQKKIWHKHPLGYIISGKKKNVKSYTSAQLKEFMSRYYVAENMVVSVAGNFNKRETLQWIKDSFADLRTRKDMEGSLMDNISTPVYRKASFNKVKDIEQLHMNMAFRAPAFVEEERYVATIVNAILGGDVNSRLFQGIREKYGLTYSVYSYGSSFSDTGLMHIYAAMNPQQQEKVYQLIMDIISDLKVKGITQTELKNARQQTVVEMTLNRDSTSSLMSANAKNIMYDIPLIPFDEKISKLMSIKKADISEYIDKYLCVEDISVGLIGPNI
ncbi:MAG: insulinase family protein [Lachnospiraceae bacterium]|nr:insulinase family protein [Lachnospiraceae bacterium]